MRGEEIRTFPPCRTAESAEVVIGECNFGIWREEGPRIWVRLWRCELKPFGLGAVLKGMGPRLEEPPWRCWVDGESWKGERRTSCLVGWLRIDLLLYFRGGIHARGGADRPVSQLFRGHELGLGSVVVVSWRQGKPHVVV